MRHSLIASIMDDDRIRGVDKAVILALASKAGPGGTVSMSLKEIERRSGWERDAVIASLDRLCHSGRLRLWQRGSGRKPSLYEVFPAP